MAVREKVNTSTPRSTGVADLREPTVVVMAKAPVAGHAKTRLTSDLTPYHAAAVHAAMLQCVLERLTAQVAGPRLLAIEGPGPLGEASADPTLAVVIPVSWRLIDQGTGDLGQRLDRLWRSLNGGPTFFLGADSPDVPAAALRGIGPALAGADAAVGPVVDGGYWVLAARRYAPALLGNIDWGSGNVYHQTCSAARRAGLSLATLPCWHDVDEPIDLLALRQRLETARDPPLLRLRDRLRRICKD